MAFSTIETAVSALRRGEPVVVLDDADRENEGDLILPAEAATPEKVAFLVRHTSGILCVSLRAERLGALEIPMMVSHNNEGQRTAFAVSVDYRHGTTTGISAADRSATLQALANPAAVAGDFVRPGHVFPLRYEAGGVLRRRGHTEAAVDLVSIAGMQPAGVLSEIVRDDGAMARRDDLEAFAQEHRLELLTIADLVAYRRRTEPLVEHTAEARLPTRHGPFVAHVFRSPLDGTEHLALVRGEVSGRDNVLVRVHSECLTGDIFGSTRCDCGEQLDAALAAVAAAGRGVVVYLRGHEGRGIGLAPKIRAYQLQDSGRDTVDANLDQGLPVDSRSYDIGAQILTELGVTTIRLMSNNPLKFRELEGYCIRVVERVPLLVRPTAENYSYLWTKQVRLGHCLNLTEAPGQAPAA
jgi:3,4-dihydroxy 2-butanone 4-phosphate synthase/GTP cyclohydrolase II